MTGGPDRTTRPVTSCKPLKLAHLGGLPMCVIQAPMGNHILHLPTPDVGFQAPTTSPDAVGAFFIPNPRKPTMKAHLVSFLKAPVGYILNVAASAALAAESAPVIHKAAVVVGGWLARPCDVFCIPDGVQDQPLFVGRDADVDGAGGLVWPELTLAESDTPGGYLALAESDTPRGYADPVKVEAAELADDIDWDEMDAQVQAFLDAPLIVRGRAL